jgi:Protein of unknown function (DUF732)
VAKVLSMMEIGRRSMVRAVLIGTVVAAVPMLMASPAIADAGEYPGNDAAFFSYMESNGYPVGTYDVQNAMREVAAATCHLFDVGGTESGAVADAVGSGISAREAHVLHVGAVNFYCPWNRAVLNS